MERLISDPFRCLKFFQQYDPFVWSADLKGIGLERDGELIVVALYEGWSGSNIWMHAAKKPEAALTSRAFFAAAFHYPFVQLGCKRATAHVEESNVSANWIAKRLGFKPEARLAGAARNGGDVIIYRLWREECRFVPPRST